MIKTFLVDFTQIIVVGVVVALIVLVRQALRVVRLRPAYRERVDRMLPTLEVVVGASFLLWAVWFLFPKGSDAVLWTGVGIVVVLVAAGWFVFRDVMAGVVLRSERAYATGQWIQAGTVEGFISKLGYRTMAIETDDGLRIKVPYSKLGQMSLTTADRTQTSRAHTFEIELPAEMNVAELTTRIRAATLTSFWSSPHREPYVHYLERRGDHHRFEVVAFSLDESYATDLEQSVRRQLVSTQQ